MTSWSCWPSLRQYHLKADYSGKRDKVLLTKTHSMAPLPHPVSLFSALWIYGESAAMDERAHLVGYHVP